MTDPIRPIITGGGFTYQPPLPKPKKKAEDGESFKSVLKMMIETSPGSGDFVEVVGMDAREAEGKI